MKSAGSAGVKGYRRLVPSMTALMHFEAVARLGSFTLAAGELGVTQAAVSKQMKLLEETLGVNLFHRAHRVTTLTLEGESLFSAVGESMQRIASVFDRLSSGSVEQELTLTTTAAFSQLRLLPRLASLKLAQPDLHLRLTTQMFTAEAGCPDIDLAVRFGSGDWSDGISIHLFDEDVFPVCAPSWLRAHGTPQTIEELAGAGLIDSDTTSEGWMNWDSWFRKFNTEPAKIKYALRCSLYTDAVQAARHGQGVALGWGRLLENLLDAGELVPLTGFSLKSSSAYYIVLPNGRAVTPAVCGVINWLRS
ncbi:LysR substrate-binding domain-containing protein [Pseudomonas sp. MOB-449]|nr:LysR substrate-binding domain-containing protein [Pseudomonas sp. MOB-449]